MRNLIEEIQGDLVATYKVTLDFLRTLGITSIEALPDYTAFRNDERISTLISGENK
jgi:chromosome segregation and condensation protein ScpB